jgi:circadian clock protein KaiB
MLAQRTRYVLRLFITGTTSRSSRAIANLRRLCEERLHGEYDLEVVDIYQHPAAAQEHQIIAAPTLVKMLPLPLRRIIGDLANEERVLAGLGLSPKEVVAIAK